MLGKNDTIVDGLCNVRRFLNFLNYDNVDAWELIAHTAGKRALAEYNAFTSFAEDMASHFDSESFRQQKFHVMKDLCPSLKTTVKKKRLKFQAVILC